MGKPPQVRRRLLKDVRNVDTIEENVLLDKKKKKKKMFSLRSQSVLSL